MAEHQETVTPEALVDLPVPRDVRISPDGSKVVYSLSPIAKATGEHYRSSIWIADVAIKHSARQVTAGLNNDISPQWSPGPSHKGCIAFISDRAEMGSPSAIYVLSLDRGEAYAVTAADKKKQIEAFKWSPDGKFIAYLSPDEKSPEQEAKDQETGDAVVYGQDWNCNVVRYLHIATGETHTLTDGNAHVTDISFNDQGTEIAIVAQKTPESDAAGHFGVSFQIINLATHQTTMETNFPGPARALTWLNHHLFFLAGAIPSNAHTSSKLYEMSAQNSTLSCNRFGNSLGSDRCMVGLRNAKDRLLVHCQVALKDTILTIDTKGRHVISEHTLGPREMDTYDGASNDTNQEILLAIITSNCKVPSEVYIQRIPYLQQNPPGVKEYFAQMDRLSQHGLLLEAHNIGDGLTIECRAEDGTACDGILVKPSRVDIKTIMPTVVLIRGGPYTRITCHFNMLYFYWVPYLVSAGYKVLCPNYRGGSSHGEEYASQARGAMGTKDYDDIITLLRHCISEGFVAADRVAIGGYSQGGFLSYLAVTRPDFNFQAAVCGAGITDWDMICMTSDDPWYDRQSAGKAPWETHAEDIQARHGSPIWHMENVKTPILILHGENDPQVPISQAVAFHRGCLHHNVPCEFVTYPREGHRIMERKHIIDMMKRIRRFYDFHLK